MLADVAISTGRYLGSRSRISAITDSSFRVSRIARAVGRSAAARGTTTLIGRSTLVGCPTGLVRLSVTVLAISSGDRAGRETCAVGQREAPRVGNADPGAPTLQAADWSRLYSKGGVTTEQLNNDGLDCQHGPGEKISTG